MVQACLCTRQLMVVTGRCRYSSLAPAGVPAGVNVSHFRRRSDRTVLPVWHVAMLLLRGLLSAPGLHAARLCCGLLYSYVCPSGSSRDHDQARDVQPWVPGYSHCTNAMASTRHPLPRGNLRLV